ncbi:hypothetical protein [Roseiconus lacunae]|uniref:Uncharacterized protein n=1 Tax=Roseiconus lacunae TaxID=2605694 RepID=A0ABT7PIM6_9BACT|nr:hypothetical protein [Roseiconus lacunae]MCD0458460.1 hypothetical protein [Roseiconus lacunae]MDM4016348.1 hypothetical protein [Roseiconus lacunae]WRQ52049.1 hypothetical protein U8335_05800 [Stieleria sp. HD01]
MHERTQRAVARLLFVFCCAVPTFLVASTILVTWTPWFTQRQRERIEYELGRETGLLVHIDAMDQVAPGKYVLRQVRVDDPETNATIADVRVIDFHRGEHQIGMLLHQVTLRSSGLGRAWSLLHGRLLSSPSKTTLPIKVEACDVSIVSSSGSLPFNHLSATITPESDGVRLVAAARDRMDPNQPSLRAEIHRDRSGDRPTSRVVLSTDGTALPCSAVAEYLPVAGMLGSEALWSGTMKCEETENGWTLDLGGCSLTNLQLVDLTRTLRYRVVGSANLHLTRCKISPGGWVSAVGEIDATDLGLPQRVLLAMRNQLGWQIDPQVLASRDGIECKLAAVHFEIVDETTTLTGICHRHRDSLGQGVALFGFGKELGWTGGTTIASRQITAFVDPPGRSLSVFNQVFLPSSPSVSIAADPRVEIRDATPYSGGPAIRQR